MSGPQPEQLPTAAPSSSSSSSPPVYAHHPLDPPTDPAMAPVRTDIHEAAPAPAGGRRDRVARPALALLLIAAAGSAVAVGLGVYGRLHEPTFAAINVAGFSSGVAAKAWLATGAFLLALVQLGSAMVMYGRIPRISAPSWIGALHRWSGRLAVLLTVPVAVHCLYALGLQTGSVRVLVHSLFGCFFYGVFVAKMLILNRHDAPRWTLPALGGAVFTALVALWLTSAAWFFGTSGITF
jgi:hypothetical protein